jgi:hypothetical protein
MDILQVLNETDVDVFSSDSSWINTDCSQSYSDSEGEVQTVSVYVPNGAV